MPSEGARKAYAALGNAMKGAGDHTVDELVSAVEGARNGYYRLVLLAGPIASGKSEWLTGAARSQGWPWLNVNLVLAEQLLERSSRERVIHCRSSMADAIARTGSRTVALDNIEMIFEAHLQQDPLRLLQSLSRSTTLVVAWPGEFEGERLTFAEPGHRDYRTYDNPDGRIITTQPQ